MPIVNTQEEYEIRSISPVHINPSIMEGRHQYESILGPDRAVSIVRYAPFFLVNPSLTGDVAIPSVLTCSAGVVDGSPSPRRTYTWFIDSDEVTTPGIGGSGPFANRFVTDITHDKKIITCVVTAFNVMGSVSARSNGIEPSIIEPIYVMGRDTYLPTGLHVQDNITTFNNHIGVVSGMWLDEYLTLFAENLMVASGIAVEEHMTVPYLDTYSVTMMTPVHTFTMSNSGAETGNMYGWTVGAGTIQSVALAANSGSRVFKPIGRNIAIMSRSFDIPPAQYALMDSGNGAAAVGYFATNNTGESGRGTLYVHIHCFDALGVDIGTLYGWDVVMPHIKERVPSWGSFVGIPELVPVGTRSLEILVGFPLPNVGDNNCEIDDISLQLWSAS